MVLLMRTRAEEEALRRRAPGLMGLGEATAAYPGIEKVCVMLHVRYSSSFFLLAAVLSWCLIKHAGHQLHI